MDFDSSGNLYVVDIGNQRVQKFDSGFNYMSQFGSGWNPWADPYVEPTESQLRNPGIVAINSIGHIFVGSESYISEFDETGTYVRRIGAGVISSPWNLTIDNDILYVSDFYSIKVRIYDTIDGEFIEEFGSYGSGQVQFYQPMGLAMNPTTHTLTICDTVDGRIESIAVGYRILNLISSADVIIRTHEEGETDVMDAYAGQSLSEQAWVASVEEPLTGIPARLTFGDYVVADFTVNLTEDRDWSLVNVQTLPWNSKSLVVNLNGTDAPGISGTHSLYLSRYVNQTEVTVCTSATTLAEVGVSCDPQYVLVDGMNGTNAYPLFPITIDGKNYWRIDGLADTGAFSTLFETDFTLRDKMTRQKINTASNHEILFGTTNDIIHASDNITIGFGPEWNLSTINISDLMLERGGIILAADHGTDIWGVEIDNTDKHIVFTAPTNVGSLQYMLAGSPITVYINNAVLINPGAAGSYPITMFIYTDDGVDQTTESGSVQVPIVDSDQVDITAYVDAYMHFDIDTGTGEVAPGDINCSPSDCLLHSTTSPNPEVYGDNYTVDLGELRYDSVNVSNGASVMHSDSYMGVINSIYLDFSTNAISGASVKVRSLNGSLDNPGGDTIVAVVDEQDIVEGDGTYGFIMPSVGTATHGTIFRNMSCDSAGSYCGPTTGDKEVLNTGGHPVDNGRLRIDLAAAASSTNTPGTYTDTLTFIATATF